MSSFTTSAPTPAAPTPSGPTRSASLCRLSPLLALALASLAAMPAAHAAASVSPSVSPSTSPSASPSVPPLTSPSVPPSTSPSTSPSPSATAEDTGTVAVTYDSCSDLPASQLLTLSVVGEGISDGGRVSRGETATTPVPPGQYEVQVRGGSGDAQRGGLTQVDISAGETTSLRTAMLCGPAEQPATDVSIPGQEGTAYSTVRVAYDSCPAYPGRPLGVSLQGKTDEGDGVALPGQTLRPGETVDFTVVGGSYTLTSDVEGVGLYGTAAVDVADDETVVLDTAIMCTVDDGGADVPIPTRIETGFAAGTPGTGGPAAAPAAAAAAALAVLVGAGGVLTARRRTSGQA